MRKYAIPLLLSLCLYTPLVVPADSPQEEPSLSKEAVEAASKAQALLLKAQKAAFEAQSVAEEAQKLAEQLEEVSYQAFLTDFAAKRAQRVAGLPKPPQPPEMEGVENPIDRFVMSRWQEGTPVAPCSDDAFLRRVYLDVLGMIPSATETQEFLTDTDPDKRAKWIDKVLARDHDYATHWIQFWEDALCSNGKHQGGVGTRGNFRDYIYNSFKENKPYDLFTAQLIDPNVMRYKGGYVRAQTHQDSLLTAANVGQVFLGTKMKCASCHDDFLNYEWTQKRFTSFASFFSEKSLEIIRCEERQGSFCEPEFMFDNGKADPDKLETLDGRLSEVTRLVIDPANPRYSAAFANRLWKRYVGIGIVEPVDAFREDTPPSHPELLQWMAYEFAAGGYDVKQMIRIILNSQTYQQQYNAELADIYKEGLDLPRYFRSPTLRKLTCEQFMDSVSLALGELKQRISFDETTTALTLALGRPTTRNEVQTLRSEDVAVIQALEYINGPDLHEMVYKAPLPEKLSNEEKTEDAVNRVFLSLLSRYPTQQERDFTMQFFGPNIEKSEWNDIIWSLVVSPEFQYIK